MAHFKLKHRALVALALAIGGFIGWEWTHMEVYYKLFEFSAAPFMDKLIFALGAE